MVECGLGVVECGWGVVGVWLSVVECGWGCGGGSDWGVVECG